MPKPVLYTFDWSVWVAVTELALSELDMVDKVDRKFIDLVKGDNFDPEFIKLNPNATLPTLVTEAASYCSTVDVVDYLAKSASVKPAPRTDITAEVHKDLYDPNLAFVIARSDEELQARASGFSRVFIETRLRGIEKWAATPAAAPFKPLYDTKIAAATGLLAIYNGTASADAKKALFSQGQALWTSIRRFYAEILPRAIDAGPFIAGAMPGEDDFHVGAWLAQVAALCGATGISDALAALERRLSEPAPPKVVLYFNAWSERSSFKTSRCIVRIFSNSSG